MNGRGAHYRPHVCPLRGCQENYEVVDALLVHFDWHQDQGTVLPRWILQRYLGTTQPAEMG